MFNNNSVNINGSSNTNANNSRLTNLPPQLPGAPPVPTQSLPHTVIQYLYADRLRTFTSNQLDIIHYCFARFSDHPSQMLPISVLRTLIFGMEYDILHFFDSIAHHFSPHINTIIRTCVEEMTELDGETDDEDISD